MMHRQANFYAGFTGTPSIGDGEGQVDAFYFPGNEGQPTLTGGTDRGGVPRTPRRCGP